MLFEINFCIVQNRQVTGVQFKGDSAEKSHLNSFGFALNGRKREIHFAFDFGGLFKSYFRFWFVCRESAHRLFTARQTTPILWRDWAPKATLGEYPVE